MRSIILNCWYESMTLYRMSKGMLENLKTDNKLSLLNEVLDSWKWGGFCQTLGLLWIVQSVALLKTWEWCYAFPGEIKVVKPGLKCDSILPWNFRC